MVDRIAAWVRDAQQVVVLTGAGISAESGVPVFRGSGGLWRQFRPEELATPEAFRRRPELVWEWYLWRRERIAAAQPNAGHVAIASLARKRSGVTLLTQNVDGLHERAGSQAPVELHGNLWRVRCSATCGFAERDQEDKPTRTTLRCACGSWVRPEVVWFGEALERDVIDAAVQAVTAADVVIVVGTSAVVYPVAGLPELAKRRGGKVVEVNVDETPLTAYADAVLRGPAGEWLPALERSL